jgi:hypothetical protein
MLLKVAILLIFVGLIVGLPSRKSLDPTEMENFELLGDLESRLVRRIFKRSYLNVAPKPCESGKTQIIKNGRFLCVVLS